MKKILIFTLLCAVSLCIVASQSNNVAYANEETFNVDGVKSFYLVEYETGRVLGARDENKRLPIASMVKIMTLLLTFEAIESDRLSYDRKVYVSDTASGMGGSQMFLDANKEYPLGDLIKGVTVCSANDAAAALAEAIGGSIEGFVSKMNQKAELLGMNDTKFANTTGLPGGEQYSTAKDVSIMTRELLSHKDYYKYSSIWLEDYVHPDGRITQMTNTNKLVRFYKGCDAGKTGFTNDAMFCLSASAFRKDLRVIATVLGGNDSKSRFKAVTELFNYAFANYEQRIVMRSGERIENNLLIKNAKSDEIGLYCDGDLKFFCKKSEKSNYKVDCRIRDDLKAPLRQNDSIGTISIIDADGKVLSSADIKLSQNVEKESFYDIIKRVLRFWQRHR